MENFNKLLFHPSALGEIYTGVKKGWSVDESLTCKRQLLKIYREIKYNRYYSFSNKQTEKGNRMENQAIELLSLYRKEFLKKNESRLTNGYFDGEPDIITKHQTIDTKCSWSLDSFPHPLVDTIDTLPKEKVKIDYELQGYGYMDLTGLRQHTIAYCLVNTPLNFLTKAKEDLYYRMDCPGDGDRNFEEYVNELQRIERNMIFDKATFLRDNPNYDFENKNWIYDIPVSERVVEFTISYDEKIMSNLKSRIDECRNWMNANFKLTNDLIAA